MLIGIFNSSFYFKHITIIFDLFQYQSSYKTPSALMLKSKIFQ